MVTRLQTENGEWQADNTLRKGRRTFLNELKVVHGPGPLLGRMFLSGDAALTRRSLTLYFGSFEEMARLNEENYETWGSLVPLFDCRYASISENEAFCLVATNAEHKIVACQAARRIECGSSQFRRMVEKGTLFYPKGGPPDEEEYKLGTPLADGISGTVTYSGGLWAHPSARKLNLGAILPRISRAIAHGRWRSDFVVSFARNALVEKGMINRYGYPNVAGPFQRRTRGHLDFDGVVVWMTQEECLRDIAHFVDNLSTEVDIGSRHSGSQQ